MSRKGIEKHLKKYHVLKFNIVLNRTFIKTKVCISCPLYIVSDYILNSLLRELTNAGHRISKGSLRDLLQSDFVERYNPIEDYFNSLPLWDNQTDHINALASTVKTTNDSLFRWAFKKWFVAFIACALDESITNHTAIIFIGIQAVGKTTWIELLLPDELVPYCYSGRINPHNKDSILQLSECILIIMEEIGTFNARDVEAFKELITKSVIRERRAYGVFSENYIRRASFIGSSNNHSILVDVTGNRRFLVFETLKFTDTSDIDLDKVYAQGYHLYNSGIQHWFDQKDIEKINAHNEQFRQIGLEEELLVKYFKITVKTDKNALFMSATEVIMFLKEKEQHLLLKPLYPVEMGKVLRAKGFDETKKKGLKKYILKLKLC